MKEETTLAHNIKLLRKQKGLSQEALATALGIKRSNVTAYETKNVEPRLRIILEIARYFDINLKDFISIRLNDTGKYPNFEDVQKIVEAPSVQMDIDSQKDIKQFVDKSMKIRKVLEGFKAFYTFKKNSIKEMTIDKKKLTLDIDNFIQLMEHLLLYNESVVKAINNTNTVNEA